MKPPSFYNRIVDVMEELARFTVMTRSHKAMLVIVIQKESRVQKNFKSGYRLKKRKLLPQTKLFCFMPL